LVLGMGLQGKGAVPFPCLVQCRTVRLLCLVFPSRYLQSPPADRSILHWERDCKLSENSNGSSVAMRSERDFEVSTRAIEHLRPWVEDETSLTEERAKACCAVLLDTLATLHPKFAK